VFSELFNPQAFVGVPSRWMPAFQRTVKGHRRGELTIVTGGSGVGKTTFLSQLSLDYLCQGVPTLWGSFEIKVRKQVAECSCDHAFAR
jgi:twinkle protein